MPVDNHFFVDLKKAFVKNKKLPFIHNPTLQTEGLLTRTPEEKNNYLELLPPDVLREVLKLLSAKELKALAATSTRFLREMMAPSTRSPDHKKFYPYLDQILVDDFNHFLKNKPMMYLFNRFFEKSDSNTPQDKAVEQTLSKVMHLDKQVLDKSVSFFYRERFRGQLSPFKLDDNGHIETKRHGTAVGDFRRGSLLITWFVVVLALLSAFFINPFLVTVGLIGLAMCASVVLYFGVMGLLESMSKDPLETIDNEQNEAPDVSEDDTAPALGIDHEEENKTPEDDDELLSAGRVMVMIP